jgi:hypothetical protein
MTRLPRLAFVALTALITAACTSLPGSAPSVTAPAGASRISPDPLKQLVVQQKPPIFVDVAIKTQQRQVGDLYIFGASITDSIGRKGSLSGTLLVASATDPNTGKVWESRTGELIFTLDGDQLLVKGAAVYPRSEREMEVNKPQVRAVIGGTGRFSGAAGEVSTVRNADGTYTHRFHLK